MLEGLTGKRLFILEDGFFLDDATRRVFEAANVLFQTVNVSDAVAYLDADIAFDGAILDMEVEADTAFLVAERLEVLEIPFLFAISDHDFAAASRSKAFRLCSDIEELKAIADGLFGIRGLQ
jgi:hypothetical protein